MSTFNKLFSPLKLGKQTIKNRIFLAPMGDNMANPDGSIGEQYIAYYAERAKGGAAVITPGVVSVHYPTGKTIVSQARLDSVNYIKGFAELATQVHRYGALLIPQIHHAGGQTWSLTTHGEEPWCVTEKESTEHALMAPYLSLGKQHEMSIDEIHELVQRFIATATFAQMAGCDGVEVHCAHGYLVNQFFSPETNQRTDEYGGSLENRMRFGREIIEGIRNACGSDFIIAARIPGYETVSNGLSQEDLITIAQTMEKAGCDYLHVSCGCVTKFSQLEETLAYEQGWRAPYAAEIKKNVSIPVVAVGAIREPEVAERLLEENLCDGVALGRTLLADPYFGEKARTGRANEIRRCISCMDGCMGNLGLNRAVCCTLNPEVGHEVEFSNMTKAENLKKVVVVGGGPGGMEAAIYAAKKGHDVTLLEAKDHLGGQLDIACVPPTKANIHWAAEWQIDELKRQNVEVKLNCKADVDTIKALNPDYVFVATGATPVSIPIPGIENGKQAWDILAGKEIIPENKKVGIIGGGIVGCEVAELMLEHGNEVSIIEMLPGVAMNLQSIYLADLLTKFAMENVNVQVNSRVKEIQPDAIVYEKDGADNKVDEDYIILALGQKPYDAHLYDELREAGIEARIIGDAKKPAKIMDAVHAGFWGAVTI